MIGSELTTSVRAIQSIDPLQEVPRISNRLL
jgi:hypothetical protein